MEAMAASSLKPQPQAQVAVETTTTSVTSPLVGPTIPASKIESTKADGDGSNTSNLPTTPPQPPLKFVDIDPKQRLPLPAPPSGDDPKLVKRAEGIVHWAISSKHENSSVSAKDKNGGAANVDTANDNTVSIKKAAQQHNDLISLLKSKTEPPQFLRAVLYAIACSNMGRELDRLVTNSKLHAQLIHYIMGLDPFTPPPSSTADLRKLDEVRRERKRNAASSSTPTSRRGVQIAESSIRHKEHPKYIAPVLPYFDYRVADTYLHLLVTLVSNNSILGMSAVRSLWVLLTEFGSRWLDWGREDMERARKVRKARRQRRSKSDERVSVEGKEAEKGSENGKVAVNGKEESGDELQPPPAKRRRMETPQQKSQESVPVFLSPQSVASHSEEPQPKVETGDGREEGEEEDVEPENERPVPGTSGLSVEFVRESFYGSRDEGGETTTVGDSDFPAEEIYSDRLASGRVRRLLLALANVFRLCPRSKLDLQRLMASNFPHHKTSHPTVHKWYSHSCLQMVRLAPTFEGPVLRLFVDKALDMDVEIKINEKGLVSLDSSKKYDGDGGQEDDGLSPVASKKRTFQQISQDPSIVSNSLAASAKKSNDTESAAAEDESDHVIEISERLDSLMTALHTYILRATSFSSTSLRSAMAAVLAARRLHRHLDSVFDAKVRTTDRSKFVQFAFFVLFGRENDALEAAGRLMAEREQRQQQQKKDDLDDGTLGTALTTKEMDTVAESEIVIPTSEVNLTDPLYHGFIAKLIDFILYNPSRTTDVVPHQTAVCYLASFVSRAMYVCPETVCECIAALLGYAEAYIAAHPSSAGAADGDASNAGVRRQSSTMTSTSSRNGKTQHQCEVHAQFYTVCQAAFYMMCFRGYEAMGYYRKALRQHESCRDGNDPDDPNAASSSELHYADPESVDIGPKRWKSLCTNALQPLKYCLESVRSEFLHLAKELDLFLEPCCSGEGEEGDDETTRNEELDKFLEHLWSTSSIKKQQSQDVQQTKTSPHDGPTAKQTRRHSTTPMKKRGGGGVRRQRRTIISTAATREKKRLDGGVGGLGRGSNPLDSFFPFDPYLLQTSYEHVRPYYRNWEDCVLTMEGEEEEMTQQDYIKGEEEDPVVYTDDDAHSEMSDLDHEEEVGDAEDAESDDDEEEDGEQHHGYGQILKPKTSNVKSLATAATATTGIALLREDDHFEMEIRRSRAMSTGSQCSW